MEITPASTTSFEEAKSQIISSQLSAKRQEAWTAWGEKTLKAAEERTVYASDDLKPATTTAAAPVTAPQTTTTP